MLAETKDVEVTIKWREPPNNGASISTYTVYQRTVSDDGTPREWNTIKVIKEEPLKLQVAVKLEKGKNYQFVVTATNRFGESLKEEGRIKTIVVLGGKWMPCNVRKPLYATKTNLKITIISRLFCDK